MFLKMSTYTTCTFSVPVWKEHYIAVLSCPVLSLLCPVLFSWSRSVSVFPFISWTFHTRPHRNMSSVSNVVILQSSMWHNGVVEQFLSNFQILGLLLWHVNFHKIFTIASQITEMTECVSFELDKLLSFISVTFFKLFSV